MKTSLSFLGAFFLLASKLLAQKISGQVAQADGAGVEFATVMLYNAGDTTLVKGAITGAEGRFEFENIAAGHYYVEASQIGLGKGAASAFEYNGSDKQLDKIVLHESAQALSAVTIVARRPVVEVRADKTILNVEGNINSQGQNALELLRKAPGVVIDNNDNISLKGKNTVRFQIDGRDVPMDSKDLAQFLKGLRAEDIAAIEMITNPSAKYDASGNAGIINFRTKKNKAIGTNGSFGGDATYGETLKGGGNLSFNHRNTWVNVYGNYGNHFGNWHNTLNLYRETDGRVFDQKSKMDDSNNNHNFKLGADFFLNDKNTVGFIVDGRHAHGPWQNRSRTTIANLNNPDAIDSVLIASNYQPQNRNNLNVNLNYRFADTLGHEFTVDFNRGGYRYRADSYQPNYYTDPSEQEVFSQRIYRNNTPTDIDMTIVKADYEQNVWKGKFGVGFKLNHVQTDNTFDFFDVVDDMPVINTDRSNRFEYDEMVNAGYVNYNFQLKKWGFQAGLRAEHTNWTGTLTSLKTDGSVENSDKYLSWFPSAAITYNLNDKNTFNLTYSRRIDRPNYRDLNPFEDKLDELAYRKGNPFLRPQFTNSVELTHTFMGFLNTTLGYAHTNDVFTEIIDTAGAGATYITNENIASQDNFSLSISAPIPVAKWWDSFWSVTGFTSSFDATFRPGFTVNESFQSMNLYSEHTFKVPGGWSLQLSGWYNSPAIWGAVFRSKSQGAVDFGIKKQLFDNNGTASLSFGDIFHTAGWKSVNDFTPGLYMVGSGTWESRTVRASFTYRFGNKNIKSAQQRKTGLEDVNRRIGGGNQ
ncbi:MAG: TonB-dependent receptor [Saprospiraceae bacterium]